MDDRSLTERYQRQVILKGFGVSAQKALLQAKVFVAGVGGLGCPVLQYLTAAGCGHIGMADHDRVSITNLHRQVLFDTSDLGELKVSAAAAKLRRMNPDTEFTEYELRLDKYNCSEMISSYDIVIDCTDNFATRYMINDACVLAGKPLVYAAVNRFEGQVAVFNVTLNNKQRTGNYRDLFPVQPLPGEVMNCAEAGVLGVLPGIIGSMQACEAIKLITGIGEPLINQLLTYNALANRVSVFKYESIKQSSASIPANSEELLQMDYVDACSNNFHQFEIDTTEFENMLRQGHTLFIDVRNEYESPLVTEFEYKRIPISELVNHYNELENNKVVFFCQSGQRSLMAARMAADHFNDNSRFFSLTGGIIAWQERLEKNWA